MIKVRSGQLQNETNILANLKTFDYFILDNYYFIPLQLQEYKKTTFCFRFSTKMSLPATQSAEASDLSDAEQGQVVSPRPSTSLGPGPSPGPISKKSRKNDAHAEKLDKAFQILQNSAARNKEDSECDLFGKLIAKKLESYTKNARIGVQQDVMGIMFQADSGFYDQPPPQPGPANLPQRPQPNFQYVYHPNPTLNIIQHHSKRPHSYASVSPISSQNSSYSRDEPRNFQQAQFFHPISPAPHEYNESSPSVCSPPECSPANPSSDATTFEELVQSTLRS